MMRVAVVGWLREEPTRLRTPALLSIYSSLLVMTAATRRVCRAARRSRRWPRAPGSNSRSLMHSLYSASALYRAAPFRHCRPNAVRARTRARRTTRQFSSEAIFRSSALARMRASGISSEHSTFCRSALLRACLGRHVASSSAGKPSSRPSKGTLERATRMAGERPSSKSWSGDTGAVAHRRGGHRAERPADDAGSRSATRRRSTPGSGTPWSSRCALRRTLRAFMAEQARMALVAPATSCRLDETPPSPHHSVCKSPGRPRPEPSSKPTRDRSARAPRPRPDERRDRETALHQPLDDQGARQAHLRKARRPVAARGGARST